MRTTIILLAAASLLASGCSTILKPVSVYIPNSTAVGRLGPEAFISGNTGVVVFSTGAPRACASKATFVEVFSQRTGREVPGIRRIGVDVYVHQSDFEDHHGTVNALHLPPGTYQLIPYVSNPYITARRTPTFLFDVLPGETTYAGELFMTASCSLSNVFVIRDRYDRDIALARERNPLLNGRPVGRSMMRPGPEER